MILPKPTAFIFDWDNTLVNTWPIIHEALNATFVEMGREPWSFETTKARVSKSMRDSFPLLFGDKWEEAAAMYQRNYRSRNLVKLEPLPGAEAVLKKIHALGIPSVVVSNKRGPNLRQEVSHMGWGDYFQNIVGADDAARDKPHADPVILAFEKTTLKSGPDVWFIGDSEVDLECAEACGCTAILYGKTPIGQSEYTATHYLGFQYHAHVHDHDQTLALLDQI